MNSTNEPARFVEDSSVSWGSLPSIAEFLESSGQQAKRRKPAGGDDYLYEVKKRYLIVAFSVYGPPQILKFLFGYCAIELSNHFLELLSLQVPIFASIVLVEL